MRKREKECRILTVHKCNRLLKLWGKKLDKLPITVMLTEGSKLRLKREMRQNRMNIFHLVIITSLCCIVLAGCGYKTPLVYVPDSQKAAKTK